MTDVNRLASDAAHGFGGALLHRDRPLRFRLDGRWIEGFDGDTVLSAALANGIVGAGRHEGAPLALTPEFAPLIRLRSADTAAALPSSRVPAIDGADLVSLAPDLSASSNRGWLAPLFSGFRHEPAMLHHRFADTATASPPWLRAAPTETLTADLVVVGAGIAGLAAAGAASALGKRVVLLERRQAPGGLLRYFGAIEGEDGPDTLLASLVPALGGRAPVRFETSAEAFRLGSGKVLAHQIAVEDGAAFGRVLDIEAAAVVIATGATERLPVFPGNRLPGVVGATSAFIEAHHHGVWQGRRVVVATPNSHAYRLALYAANAGVAVQRMVDARLAPHSRYIDFCKATGITLGSGLVVAGAGATKDGGLEVMFAAALDEMRQDGMTLGTDLLVAAGGFQPELSLWLGAGGAVAWNPAVQSLMPQGSLDGVRIAGAAAGWRGNTAAMASGRAAALDLLGKVVPPVEERLVPTQFETPDAPTPFAPRNTTVRGTAYFDRAGSLVTADRIDYPASLTLGDLAAAVALGLLPPSEADAVARERTLAGADLVPSQWQPARTDAAETIPPYLVGRFGPKPVTCRLTAPDAKAFSVGSLVFRSRDTADALMAIGVVIAAPGPGDNGGTALIDDPPDSPDTLLFVNENGGPSPARVAARPG